MQQVFQRYIVSGLGAKGSRPRLPSCLFRLRGLQEATQHRRRVRPPRGQSPLQDALHGNGRRSHHLIRRGRRFRIVPQQEQGEESEDDIHGRAASSAPGQLSAGLQPRRSGPREDSPDHRAEQEGDPSVVPELEGQAEEAHAYGKKPAEQWPRFNFKRNERFESIRKAYQPPSDLLIPTAAKNFARLSATSQP
ncbi:hypothetical protein AAG570_004488 [Ranatra chinensis]|uniref:Uncharacterized protein n=1 Tax=Ranatra chinensis TaxID=642074 RepID=A0ABD0Y120_9HEMI